MFMLELGSELLLPSDPCSPSPASTTSPSVTPTCMFTPSPVVSSSSSPSPPPLSPSLSPLPEVPTRASSPASEASQAPVFDNPLLADCFGLDGLLNDPALFESSMSSDSDLEFTFSSHNAQDLLDLSDCLPLHYSTLPPSDCSTTLPEQAMKLDMPADPSTPLSLDSPVSQDCSPASSSEILTPPSIKRKVTISQDCSPASSSDILTPSSLKRKVGEISSADGSSAVKKAKQALKDERYHVRRQKNNVASQVSRAKRRARHADLYTREKELEEENAKLKSQIAEMEAEAKRLKKSLISKLSTT